MPPFAQQVRDTIKATIGADEYRLKDLALHLDLIADKEKQKLYRTHRDFLKRGEVVKVRDGVFKYARTEQIRPAHKRGKMWSLLRSRRLATVEDMVMLAGVKKSTAQEFFQEMARREIVRRIDQPGNKPAKYQMIADPVEMPAFEDQAAKFRAIRVASKKAAAAIDQAAEKMIAATHALAECKQALEDIPEVDA